MQEEKEKALVMDESFAFFSFHDWPQVVSGAAKQRDDLENAVRGHLDEEVDLLELEYQPKEE